MSTFPRRRFSVILGAMKAKRPGHPESGSVIIYIFIGVALFAALGFAVGQMMRGGSPSKNLLEWAWLFRSPLFGFPA